MLNSRMKSKLNGLVRKTENALDAKASSAVPTSPVKRTAHVTRQDSEGTWWVRLLGSETDTPVNTELPYFVEPGDELEVEITGTGYLRVISNRSDPSVGSAQSQTLAFEAITESLDVSDGGEIAEAIEAAKRISEKADNDLKSNLEATVKAIAEAAGVAYSAEEDLARNIAMTAAGFKSMSRALHASNQHFWNDDEGFHVADGSKDPLADHNMLGNSMGMFLRNNERVRVGIVEDGVFVGDGTVDDNGNWTATAGKAYTSYLGTGMTVFDATGNALGTFAGGSATIGYSSGYHVVAAANGSSAGVLLMNGTTIMGSFTNSGVVVGNPNAAHSSFTSSGVTIFDQNNKPLGTFAGGSATIGPSISSNKGWKLVLGPNGVSFHYTSNNGSTWTQAAILALDSNGNLGLQSGSILLNDLRVSSSGIEYVPHGFFLNVSHYGLGVGSDTYRMPELHIYGNIKKLSNGSWVNSSYNADMMIVPTPEWTTNKPFSSGGMTIQQKWGSSDYFIISMDSNEVVFGHAKTVGNSTNWVKYRQLALNQTL